MAIAQDQPTTTGRRPTARLLVGIGAVIFVLVVARWLTTPWSDSVPVTPQKDLPAGTVVEDLPTAAHYRCSAVLDTNEATATEQAVDALAHQDRTREPCAPLRTQRKVVGGVDVVLAVVVVGGVLVLRWRRT